MSFQTTKKEAAELYTFFRLLEKGTVAAGTANAQPDDNQSWPIAMIEREEHDGTCRYHIKKDSIEMIHGTKSRDGVFSPYESSEKKACVSRSGFATAADLLLQRLKEPSGEQIEVPDELESFLNSLCIYNLEAQTNDRTDLKIAFWEAEAPLHGFVIRCRLSPMNPLLDGGRTTALHRALARRQGRRRVAGVPRRRCGDPGRVPRGGRDRPLLGEPGDVWHPLHRRAGLGARPSV